MSVSPRLQGKTWPRSMGISGRVQQSLMLTPEILENHGYNVEEGNHEEIKKRTQILLSLEGIHDNPHGDSSWRRTNWNTSCREWTEEGVEIRRRRLAARASKGTSTRMGHDLRPDSANAEGQQICAQATSWTTTWV